MAKYVTKIRTTDGDLQIDYNALANLPEKTTLNSLGVVAKPDELNYMSGVTSPVQDQIESTHDAANITVGTLLSDRLPVVPITKGGTGASDADMARTNLGAASSVEVGEIESLLSGLRNDFNEHTEEAVTISETVDEIGALLADLRNDFNAHADNIVPIAQGGTGATTEHEAREALGITPENIGALPTVGGTMTGNLFMNGGYIILTRGKNYGTEDEIPEDFPEGGMWLKVVE